MRPHKPHMLQHISSDSSEFIHCTRCMAPLSILFMLLVALLFLAACDSSTAAGLRSVPTAPATAVPTATPQPPSPTPTASTTPTSTPQPPTPTPSPTPSPAPPTATVTPVPQVRIIRATLPNGVTCPIRELPAPEGAALIGRSAVCRLPIISYRHGQGETTVILVGGIHGGYEWNTIQLAEKMHEYLLNNPQAIPPSLSVYLIPNANPDGLYAVTKATGSFEPPLDFEKTKAGRFNGREVDLNRNWACDWSADAYWGKNPVSGGAAPFSEPETLALRDYFLQSSPAVVLFWHSAAGAVYAAGCGYQGPISSSLAEVYRPAAGYKANERFEGYEISGDAGNWLASMAIPAITVELSTHSALDWEENLAGVEALLNHIAAEAAD